MKPLPLKIAGMGRYLPKRIVTNAEVEQLLGLESGWVDQTAAGVKQRRWVDGETASWMGAEAAKEALADAGKKIGDIDLIINASGTPEQAIPDGGPLIQNHLGAGNSGIACFSIHATCLSFLPALNMSANFFASGQHRNILIVSSDVVSACANPSQPESFILFGDGAAAAVVTAPQPGEASTMDGYILRTFGSSAEHACLRGWGTARPPHSEKTKSEDNYFFMDGFELFGKVVDQGAKTMEMLRPGLSKGLGDIKLVVSHQPSMLAIRSLRRVGIPPENVVVTLDTLGNCGAASLPLTLYEAVKQGRVERGDKMLLMGAGAGMTFGLAIVTY